MDLCTVSYKTNEILKKKTKNKKGSTLKLRFKNAQIQPPIYEAKYNVCFLSSQIQTQMAKVVFFVYLFFHWVWKQIYKHTHVYNNFLQSRFPFVSLLFWGGRAEGYFCFVKLRVEWQSWLHAKLLGYDLATGAAAQTQMAASFEKMEQSKKRKRWQRMRNIKANGLWPEYT